MFKAVFVFVGGGAALLASFGWSLDARAQRPQPGKMDYSPTPVRTAVPFAEGTISTADSSEFDIAFAPDGRTAYFTRRGPQGKQKILTTRFEGGKWTAPRLASFSTDRDETPFVSSDGQTLFFASERPLPGRPNLGSFDMNIWQVAKTADGWGTPTPLPATINAVQRQGEEWPSSNANFIFSLDGKQHYYTTMARGSKSIDLYSTTYANGAFSKPEKIDGLFADEKYWKYSAVLSPDGNYLLFNSYGAPGGVGGEDIYVSRRTRTGWTPAKGIGALVNTKAEESSPRFSPDGKYFFFGREVKTDPSKDGIWSIYYLETAALELENLF